MPPRNSKTGTMEMKKEITVSVRCSIAMIIFGKTCKVNAHFYFPCIFIKT
jgi:hypothetical protein